MNVNIINDNGVLSNIEDTIARQDIATLQISKADKTELPTIDSQVTSDSENPVESSAIYSFVNSSVSTNTAYFVGTYNSLAELEAHESYTKPLTNNDYGFVISTDSAGNTIYNRYKYNITTNEWTFEYALNNSSFTANQWATINSGVTATDKTQIDTNTTNIQNLEINKVDKETGKGLSTNDFTNELLSKLQNIEAEANKTIVDTELSATSSNPVQNAVVTENLNNKFNKADNVRLSQAEYDAIGPEKYVNGKTYWIWDSDSSITEKTVIYGYHIDPDESDPSAAVSYLEDAVGMTPAAMGSTTFNYGSWQNAFFMPRPCMVRYDGTVDYYLNPNNYSLKEDGTASDVANSSYEGNAMMEWPKIYYKFEAGTAEGEGYFYCSNKQIDDTYHCWCNYDANNNVINHFYTSIYNGTGTTQMRSLSGVQLTPANGNGNTTGATEVTRATANNTTSTIEWYTSVFSDRMLINALLILMSKSLDCQTKFGQGISSGSQTAKEAYVTGSLDDKGLFYGDISGTSTAVKVFGMENWWSCVWDRVAGCVGLTNGTIAIKMTYGTIDGTTVTGYNNTGNGYINLDFTRPTANDYVKSCKYNQYGYFPIITTGGSASTYYCDYWYTNNAALTYLLVGGDAGYGAYVGFSLFDLYNGFSDSNWHFSARLALKPLGGAART